MVVNQEAICPTSEQICPNRNAVVTFRDLSLRIAESGPQEEKDRVVALAGHLLNDANTGMASCRGECPIPTAAVELLFKTASLIPIPLAEAAAPPVAPIEA